TLVREIARYQPDLLIVYHGHNETATRFSAADRLWLNPHSLRSRLVDSRLYEMLSRVLPASATSRLVAPRDAGRPGGVGSVGRRVYSTQADRRLSAALFEARLVEIVRLMHGAGARTMLLTLSQNFSEWAPAIAVHRTGMRPDELAAWRAAVRAGDQLAPHDCEAALAVWSQALAIDPDFADLEFRMAQCEQTLRRLEEANIRFRRASDLDRLPHGAPTAFNDILRDVARREDAILVDVDAAFLRASGPRLVGNDLFVEAVHLNIRGQQLIATVLAEAIRAARIGAPEVQWDPDAYIEPSPDAVLAADPGLAGLEKLLRAVVCAGAGRPGCKTTFSGTDIDAPD
ncbi:MAG: hypothetical protein ACRERC_13835, partial [Candidatus Binatia bacterium]